MVELLFLVVVLALALALIGAKKRRQVVPVPLYIRHIRRRTIRRR